jgi:hypothetical protein
MMVVVVGALKLIRARASSLLAFSWTPDLVNLPSYKLEFSLGTPFYPFQQLMGVLPAASKTLLPVPYQELMTRATSPIIDFYPEEFKVLLLLTQHIHTHTQALALLCLGKSGLHQVDRSYR